MKNINNEQNEKKKTILFKLDMENFVKKNGKN